MLRLKMAAKNDFRDQNLKKKIAKKFFNKIGLKVGEHKYIYIFEKKKMAAKTSFVILHNNANLCLLVWKWRR